MRISVRAPRPVVSTLCEVTGQFTSAALAWSPASLLMPTWPCDSETRPTRAGGSASASVENTAHASSVTALMKRVVMWDSIKDGRGSSHRLQRASVKTSHTSYKALQFG